MTTRRIRLCDIVGIGLVAFALAIPAFSSIAGNRVPVDAQTRSLQRANQDIRSTRAWLQAAHDRKVREGIVRPSTHHTDMSKFGGFSDGL